MKSKDVKRRRLHFFNDPLKDLYLRVILYPDFMISRLALALSGDAHLAPGGLYIRSENHVNWLKVFGDGVVLQEDEYRPESANLLLPHLSREKDSDRFKEIAGEFIDQRFAGYLHAAIQAFQALTLDHTLRTLAEEKGVPMKPSSKEDYVQHLSLIEQAVRLKRRGRGGADPKYTLTKAEIKALSFHYRQLQKVYREGKNLYKIVKGYNTWREMIKKEYEALESDLIELWRTGDRSDDQYNYSPANMAIEHAARVSIKNYQPFGLTPQRLRSYLPHKRSSR